MKMTKTGRAVLFLGLVLMAFSGQAQDKVSAPGKYEGYSAPIYKGMAVKSQYVTMRDGVKIAVDYYLPRGLPASEKIPAIVCQTRYWRSMVIAIKKDPAFKFLVSHGYAVVAVDVRGTGASFGAWPYPWAEDEVKDGAEVVDWIVEQPWSSGAVGTYGNSYVGASAEFLTVNKHPAVKAAFIRYSLIDSYADIAYPGGIRLDWFLSTWNSLDKALDANDMNTLARASGMTNPFGNLLPGVKSVGYPWKGRAMLKAAIEDHENNGDVYQESLNAQFRDDYSDNWVGTIERISPYFYFDDIEASGVAVYSYSGWFDGAYTNPTINRYLTISNPRKLIIGPWPHGGRENISPWRESREVKFDHNAELLRFFDYHLKGIENGIMNEPPIHYYTMGEEKWKAADSWPPKSRKTTYYFSDGNELRTEAPGAGDAFDTYKVDYSTGTGVSTRYTSLVNLKNVPIGYPDRVEKDAKLLVYETAPLTEDMEVTGHPVVRLWVASSEEDGQFFVYLEDVSPGGTVSYITEGMLRAVCREVSSEPPLYKSAPGVPYHTFKRTDARPLVPGEVALITFDLQPTSVLFMKGHQIRIAIAGADKDQFALPEGPEPELTFHRSAKYASSIDLPVVAR